MSEDPKWAHRREFHRRNYGSDFGSMDIAPQSKDVQSIDILKRYMPSKDWRNADGSIPSLLEPRLPELGDWLKVNGEAIYGTYTAVHAHQWTDEMRPTLEYGEFMVRYNLTDQAPCQYGVVSRISGAQVTPVKGEYFQDRGQNVQYLTCSVHHVMIPTTRSS